MGQMSLTFRNEDNGETPVGVDNPLPVGGGRAYTLLDDASATGDPVENILAGSYIFAVAGTFGSTSAQLQVLGPDGATYINVGTAVTSAGRQGVVLGQNATAKVVLTGGSPNGMFANLS